MGAGILPAVVVADRMLTLVDTSPLTGESIDVGARIGWTLRMARLTASSGIDARLRSMARELGSSSANLSRLETGQRRVGVLIDGYERVLGLAEGSLRAPVDVLCRGFARVAPRDADPGGFPATVEEMSALTEAVLGPEPVSGGQWMRWSGALAQPGNLSLPRELFLGATRRLCVELGRSVGSAYPTRYEALSRLRCSPYGRWVVDVAREVVADPCASGTFDVMSGVGESWADDVESWFLELLRTGTTTRQVMAGSLGLENTGEIVGERFWESVFDELVAAFDASAAGSASEEWAAHLLRLVPLSVLDSCPRRPARPLPPVPEGDETDASTLSALWEHCVEAAERITVDLGLARQPMLARLLYDVAFCPWESRAVTSYMLLDALDAFAGGLAREVHHLASVAPASRIKERLVSRWMHSPYAHDASLRGDWIGDDDPVVRGAGLEAAGASGVQLPEAVLLEAMADPRTASSAVISAGLSGHRLVRVGGGVGEQGGPLLREEVRHGLAWWASAGARITL